MLISNIQSDAFEVSVGVLLGERRRNTSYGYNNKRQQWHVQTRDSLFLSKRRKSSSGWLLVSTDTLHSSPSEIPVLWIPRSVASVGIPRLRRELLLIPTREGIIRRLLGGVPGTTGSEWVGHFHPAKISDLPPSISNRA